MKDRIYLDHIDIMGAKSGFIRSEMITTKSSIFLKGSIAIRKDSLFLDEDGQETELNMLLEPAIAQAKKELGDLSFEIKGFSEEYPNYFYPSFLQFPKQIRGDIRVSQRDKNTDDWKNLSYSKLSSLQTMLKSIGANSTLGLRLQPQIHTFIDEKSEDKRERTILEFFVKIIRIYVLEKPQDNTDLYTEDFSQEAHRVLLASNLAD